MSLCSLTLSLCNPKPPAELNEMSLLNFPSSSASTVGSSQMSSELHIQPKSEFIFPVEGSQSQSWNFGTSVVSDFPGSPLTEVYRAGIEDQFLRPVQQEYAHASYFTPPTIPFPIPDNGRSYPGQCPLSLIPPTLIPPTPSTSQSTPYWDHGSLSSTPTTPLSFQPQSSFSESVVNTHVAPLTYQDQLVLWKEARNLPAAGGNPVFILQRIYKPHTTSDIKRYVQEASLDPPIFFWMDGPEECGISLNDSLHGRTKRLRDRDMEVFEGRGPSVSIRLEWPGYRQWSRQIPTKDFKSPPRPISMTKLCKNVAKCVQRFILERQHCELEEGTDPRWKVGDSGIRFEDLVLVSLHHVSMGSWQPQLRFRKRMK